MRRSFESFPSRGAKPQTVARAAVHHFVLHTLEDVARDELLVEGHALFVVPVVALTVRPLLEELTELPLALALVFELVLGQGSSVFLDHALVGVSVDMVAPVAFALLGLHLTAASSSFSVLVTSSIIERRLVPGLAMALLCLHGELEDLLDGAGIFRGADVAAADNRRIAATDREAS